ncbi:MAG: hypothetical protein ACRBCT_00840 [Alphaproteobacteria bacterium]
MKLILHIGQSKTGTTALQTYLRNNAVFLKQYGVLYPDYYIAGKPINTLNHNSFATALCGLKSYPDFSADVYFDQFLQQLEESGCHSLLLSAENFFGAPHIWGVPDGEGFYSAHEKKIKTLRRFAQNFEIHLIGYFKPPHNWFETVIPQIIKYEGLGSAGAVYESDEQLFELLKPVLEIHRLLKLWEDVLKPDVTTFVPYIREELLNGDIVADFLRRAHIDFDGLSSISLNYVLNEALDRRFIEVKKILNKRKRTHKDERVITACLNRMNAQYLQKSRIEKYRIDTELMTRVQAFCAPVCDIMSQRYGRDDEPFFKTQGDDAEQNVLLDSEIQNLLNDFEALYMSWPMRWERVKITLKAKLMHKYPKLYACLKNIVKP